MTNFVAEIFAKLESRLQPSVRNSVVTSNGEIVRIENDLWAKSAVLKRHALSGDSMKILPFSKGVLSDLITVHENGVFPRGVVECYEILAAASELELKDVTSECFNHLLAVQAVDGGIEFPVELPSETLMRALKVFLDCPLRSAEVYEDLLCEVWRYCAHDRDFLTNVINFFKQGLEKFKSINLEGIPVDFDTRMLPVVIYKRKDRVQTAIVFESELMPVNLLGDKIELEDDMGIEGFYLKYGTYLLYLCDDHVYQKNLQDHSDPVLVMTNCYIFITRKNFVFAVHKEGSHYTVSLWVDDERFEVIYQSVDEITILDFECETRVLAVELSERNLLLFRLEDSNLILLKENEISGVIDVILTEREMFLVRKDTTGFFIETHSNPDEGSGPFVGDGKRLLEKSETSAAWSSLERHGGSFFLTNNGRLELVTNFPRLDGKQTFLTDGELFAVSELWISP